MPIDHRQLGVDLFNGTWTLMEQADRTPDDDALMIHMAHASAVTSPTRKTGICCSPTSPRSGSEHPTDKTDYCPDDADWSGSPTIRLARSTASSPTSVSRTA